MEDTLDYVVTCSHCGGLSAWIVNDPHDAKWVAKEVGNWIKDGANVQRMMTSETRKAQFCRHECRSKRVKK